jgi:D-glycero-alpha-D-manno-heptose-7-phosphate kinase
MLISRTPYRISLAGGGTDFPEWFKHHPSAVVSGTINKYSYITCRPLDKFFEHNYRIVYSLIENVLDIEDVKHPAVREVIKFLEYKSGLEIHHDGDLPARTGLGSSSAFTVGLLQLVLKLQNIETSKERLAKLAIKIERDLLNENVGMQDQIACAYGGINKVTFEYIKDSPEFKVSPISISKERLELLQSQIKLIYTGKQRFSSRVSEKLVSNLNNKSNVTEKIQLRNVEMAHETVSVLEQSKDYLEMSEIFEESWVNKKQLNPESITRELQDLKDYGMQNGGSGTKVLGAGGGGFLAFWVTESNREKFLNAFKDYVIVDFTFENEGSKIIYE